MPKILHTADLHLKRDGEDRSYGLSVLDELVSIANARRATHFLICGDLFDSFADFSDSGLIEDVKKSFNKLSAECAVIFISGNHENLGKAAGERLSAYNFGKIRFVAEKPELLEYAGVEIIAVPFMNDYSGLASAIFPDKKNFRIVMIHGTNSSVYSGPDAELDGMESGVARISDLLMLKLQADYAALGHIHSARQGKYEGITAVYPGSPRVWRKGETGPRTAMFIETGENGIAAMESIEIRSAGQYREVRVPINVDGSFANDIATRLMREAEKSPNDWYEIIFSGVAEDSNLFEERKTDLHSSLSSRLRKCTLNSIGVRTLSALSDNSAARAFLEAMEKCRPSEDGDRMQAWLQARIMGLEQINEEIKNR